MSAVEKVCGWHLFGLNIMCDVINYIIKAHQPLTIYSRLRDISWQIIQ